MENVVSITQKIIPVFDDAENFVEKGEYSGYQRLLIPDQFFKSNLFEECWEKGGGFEQADTTRKIHENWAVIVILLKKSIKLQKIH